MTEDRRLGQPSTLLVEWTTKLKLFEDALTNLLLFEGDDQRAVKIRGGPIPVTVITQHRNPFPAISGDAGLDLTHLIDIAWPHRMASKFCVAGCDVQSVFRVVIRCSW